MKQLFCLLFLLLLIISAKSQSKTTTKEADTSQKAIERFYIGGSLTLNDFDLASDFRVDDSPVNFSLIFGYRFNKFLSAELSGDFNLFNYVYDSRIHQKIITKKTGVDYNESTFFALDENVNFKIAPIYCNAKISFSDKNVSPFLNLSIGSNYFYEYSIPIKYRLLDTLNSVAYFKETKIHFLGSSFYKVGLGLNYFLDERKAVFLEACYSVNHFKVDVPFHKNHYTDKFNRTIEALKIELVSFTFGMLF